jgi:asparagine synthase (glutamine-hydrolysing)
VFGGYERYRAHALAGRVPSVAAQLALRVPFGRTAPRSGLYRARRFLEVAATPASDRYARLVEIFPLELRRRLWADDACAQAARDYLPANSDPRLTDLESYLPGDILRKADLTSMAASLELRAPLLDRRLVELGLALPHELAFGKVALKQAFGSSLPPTVTARKKTGFGVPLDRWFRHELREASEDLLLARDRGLFDRGQLELLLREHASAKVDRGHQLWCLCMLELWQRRHLDPPAVALAA